MSDISPNGNQLAKASPKIFLAVGLLTIVAIIVLASQLRAAVPPSALADLMIVTLDSNSLTSHTSATATATPFPTPPTRLVSIKRLTVTPPPNGRVITLTTTADAIGWASDLDGRSHFNMPNLHVGSYQGHLYYGAIQFDLSEVPLGSTISYAALELVGLDDRRLGQGGSWQLNVLEASVAEAWSEINFETLAAADSVASVPLETEANELAPNNVNRFAFDAEARAVLEQRLANGVISFRLEGPTTASEDNLFSWDSGHGRQADASRLIVLSLAVIPPATPLDIPFPTSAYVIVTSTPTPENIITVAALAAEATRFAEMVGTATPVPTNWVTPIIVTPQTMPLNTATAAYLETEATAKAFLYGPATATPFNVWTATPTSELITAGDGSTMLAPPTQTATPTPVLVMLDGDVATPWATPTPTATQASIPAELVGKIAFLSNRSGGPEPLSSSLVYVIDPDGSNLAVLTNRSAYDAVIARDCYSADQRFRVFVKDAIRFDNQKVPALYFYDYFYNAEEQITHFGAGVAWDPVWSPTREQIAFVSNDSADNEIWIVNRDGSHSRQLTASNEAYNAREIGKDTFIPEVNGQPSWSPDGSQIVFWSNRTGNRQIWVMNADGSNLYSLSTTNHDDWNPVWIKYTDPARDPVPDSAR